MTTPSDDTPGATPEPVRSTERHERVKQLFVAALDVPRARRAAFLAEACGGEQREAGIAEQREPLGFPDRERRMRREVARHREEHAAEREAKQPDQADKAAAFARIIDSAVRRAEAERAQQGDAYWKERDRGKGWERDQ